MTFDAIFVGGGLANSLAAYRLRQRQPQARFLILEMGPQLGGEHTWSFHHSDLASDARSWMAPLISRSWSGYDVRFPGRQRTLPGTYHSIDSREFAQKLMPVLGERLRLNTAVTGVTAQRVETEKETWSAHSVFDGRGWNGEGPCAFQKFVGLRLQLRAPHGLLRPLLMDATVPQVDGFRFFYLLPWSEREILIEDTHYSDRPEIEEASYREAILSYVASRGWRVERVTHSERGSLPLPLSGRWPAGAVTATGLRAGLFHPTTGYSLPAAVRFADRLASLDLTHPQLVHRECAAWQRKHWQGGSFLRMLNRMMFFAASPPERYRIFSRFYALPESLIERFYAGELRWLDKIRILSGRPPVSIGPALRSIMRKGSGGEIGFATRVTGA